ncbi:MAG: hypothetical protein H0U62_00375 [Actinobacteria bacterium]|nr:hypothetical protein [Actinomycetota bacterium]
MKPAPPQEARDPAAEQALLEEAMKRSGLVWVTLTGGTRAYAVWHIWLDGCAYVVSGGAEQLLPGIGAAGAAGDEVLVTVASKERGNRLMTWVARVDTVRPDGPDWDATVAALHAKRLNAPDGEEQPARWARESVVSRLTPTGVVPEAPGRLPTGSLAAPPPPTPATTRGPLPFVVGGRRAARLAARVTRRVAARVRSRRRG